MKNKAIIIGASTAGKSTIIKYLRENTDLEVDEMDDMLTRMNEGIYPKDGSYRHDVLEPRMVKEMLEKHHAIFFTNTNIFSVDDLKSARELGFVVIQLALSLEEMEKRNKHRVDHQDWDDVSMYFKYMVEYQEDIKNKGVVDREINANQPIEVIAKELIEILS